MFNLIHTSCVCKNFSHTEHWCASRCWYSPTRHTEVLIPFGVFVYTFFISLGIQLFYLYLGPIECAFDMPWINYHHVSSWCHSTSGIMPISFISAYWVLSFGNPKWLILDLCPKPQAPNWHPASINNPVQCAQLKYCLLNHIMITIEVLNKILCIVCSTILW